MSDALEIAPFTWDDIESLPDWRCRLHWPVPLAEIIAIGRQVPGQIISFAASQADQQSCRLVLLVGKLVASAFMSLLEAALVCDRANRLGIKILGGPPEIPRIAAGADFSVLRFRGPFGVQPLPNGFLRGMARTASWCPAWRLPQALARPTAVAVTHNALLRASARRHAIVYRHASNIVLEARGRSVKHGTIDAEPLCGAVFDHLIRLVADLRPAYRERTREAFIARLSSSLALVGQDVAGLRETRLPKRIWCGTGGAYPTRAVACEVLRRGGSVDAFDHGGVTGISQLPGSTALTELSVSTKFHVATPDWSELLKSSDAVSIAAPVNRAEIVGEKGEPTFRQAFRDAVSSKGPRKRVIYIGHPYRGLRQFPIAALPDVAYWDFQLHLVELLRRMNIDLLCKPHPEGHFIGKRNPLEDYAPVSYRPFEEHLDDADLFLFDAPTSTTFLETLCTRRPVVLIDRLYSFNRAVLAEIRRRCTIVRTISDERNRLRVDPDELAAAILDAPRDVDPSFFRRLTAG